MPADVCERLDTGSVVLMRKHVFFALRLWRDLTHPVSFDIAGDLHASRLGAYYFLFDERSIANQKGATRSFVLDKEGIPVTPTYVDVTDKGYIYYPITIGQFGLAVFESFLASQSERDRNRFLRIADWFYENRIEDHRLGSYWLTDVSLPAYRNPGPWQSAFAQGRAISVLLRSYQLTEKAAYLETARDALKPFLFPVSEGGVTSFTEWGPFYEEYTADVPTLVLNGMIFSLCGLYDFVRVYPENDLARRLFWEGIETVIQALPAYDLGFWTRYNYCQAAFHPKVDPATVGYHRLHVTQLNMLYQLTHREIFREYSEKWAKYDVPGNALRMYLVKYKALKKMRRL